MLISENNNFFNWRLKLSRIRIFAKKLQSSFIFVFILLFLLFFTDGPRAYAANNCSVTYIGTFPQYNYNPPRYNYDFNIANDAASTNNLMSVDFVGDFSQQYLVACPQLGSSVAVSFASDAFSCAVYIPMLLPPGTNTVNYLSQYLEFRAITQSPPVITGGTCHFNDNSYSPLNIDNAAVPTPIPTPTPTPTPTPNNPPVINPISSATINQGNTYTASGSFTDIDSTYWTATVDYGDGSGIQVLPLSGTNFSLSHTYNLSGTFTVTVRVTDNQGATGTGTGTVFVNAPPHINPFSGATINEGDTYFTSGSFSDTDSTSWAAVVDYGDGSGIQPLTLSGMNFSLSHIYKDEGVYMVTVAITDNQGATGTGTAAVTVNNAPFTVSAITAPTKPQLVNTTITASASFTDPGVLDTHTATWNWGDGNTTIGTVTETSGPGTISNSHTYTQAGVYTLTLTVTDDDGVSNSVSFQYVVIYDPTAGFLTIGGLYTSQAGWYLQNPQASGKVPIGVSAKYISGNTVPTGHTLFNFISGNLKFISTSYNWLVVSGAKAFLEGNGTINGSGNYNFLVSAIDGNRTGGSNLIRVRITDSSNNLIYDTQIGAPEGANPITILTSGSIKVH